MNHKVAIYADPHQEPPRWNFRPTEIGTEGELIARRRRKAFLIVPMHFNVLPATRYRKNRIHPDLELCARNDGARRIRLTAQEAVNRFKLVE